MQKMYQPKFTNQLIELFDEAEDKLNIETVWGKENEEKYNRIATPIWKAVILAFSEELLYFGKELSERGRTRPHSEWGKTLFVNDKEEELHRLMNEMVTTTINNGLGEIWQGTSYGFEEYLEFLRKNGLH